ncbi:hypothetical protein [Plasmodium yoelii yoelii]|uniref:Uncharacterized protein n=1 Tax=Plasmodium yoelii yoelii TaxID=73239 RepID=Q7PCY0_PLAYO|nr:hypothetical protein [Plasmodium yoelii yoelii]EAA21594.1 hypothetical protein [Plasmodium yoelii yoelii]
MFYLKYNFPMWCYNGKKINKLLSYIVYIYIHYNIKRQTNNRQEQNNHKTKKYIMMVI